MGQLSVENLNLFYLPGSNPVGRGKIPLLISADDSTFTNPKKGPRAPFGLCSSSDSGFSISRHRWGLHCWSGLGADWLLAPLDPAQRCPQYKAPHKSPRPVRGRGSRCLALCTTHPGKLEVWMAPRPAHFQELTS